FPINRNGQSKLTISCASISSQRRYRNVTFGSTRENRWSACWRKPGALCWRTQMWTTRFLFNSERKDIHNAILKCQKHDLPRRKGPSHCWPGQVSRAGQSSVFGLPLCAAGRAECLLVAPPRSGDLSDCAKYLFVETNQARIQGRSKG